MCALGTWLMATGSACSVERFSFARKLFIDNSTPDVSVDVIDSYHRVHSNFCSHSYLLVFVVTVLMQLYACTPLVGVVSL